MVKRILTAIITKGKKFYVAENPETGVVSQGKTVNKAVTNLKEAVELYLAEFPEESKERTKPLITIFEA